MNTEKELTGYPSIDKPWLKYYSDEAINAPLPEGSMYEYLYERNKNNLSDIALNYFGKKTTYKDLFDNIDIIATALQAYGVKKGDKVGVCVLTSPEAVYLLYAINKVGAINVLLGFTSPVSDLKDQIKSTECKIIFSVEMAYPKIVDAIKDAEIDRIITVPLEYSMPCLMRFGASIKIKHPALNSRSIKWTSFL